VTGVVVRGGTTGVRAGMTGNTGGQHDGSTGSTQGDKLVITPATRPTSTNTNMRAIASRVCCSPDVVPRLASYSERPPFRVAGAPKPSIAERL
jgi:hypothetical protein